MISLTDLPRNRVGQISWKRFYAEAEVNRTYILPEKVRMSAAGSARNAGTRVRCHSNPDGTFNLTILAPMRQRDHILAAFATLSDGRLKALHDAAVKSELLMPLTHATRP